MMEGLEEEGVVMRKESYMLEELHVISEVETKCLLDFHNPVHDGCPSQQCVVCNRTCVSGHPHMHCIEKERLSFDFYSSEGGNCQRLEEIAKECIAKYLKIYDDDQYRNVVI
jgi:hypothetical protein